MVAQSFVTCAVLLATVGCARELPTSQTDVAGQYTMVGLDGSGNLPCCSQADSAGTVVTIVGGGMEVGWNVPAGTYWWDLLRQYDYPNGTSQQVQSRFAAGSYTWDGRTLVLVDSAGVRMTGAVNGGVVTVERLGHQYEFWRLIEMPH